MNRTLLLLLVLASTPACAYLHQTGRNFEESFHLGVGVSIEPGVLAYATAPVLGTSLGYLGNSYYVGTDYGYTHGWHQIGQGILVDGELARSEFGHSIHGLSVGRERHAYLDQSQYGLINYVRHDHRDETSPGSISLTQFEVGMHFVFVGMSIGLDYVQLADAFTGLVGYDLLGDDGYVPLRAEFDVRGTPVVIPGEIEMGKAGPADRRGRRSMR